MDNTTNLVADSGFHVVAETVQEMLGTEQGGIELTEDHIEQLQRIVPKGEKKVFRRTCAETGEEFLIASSDLHQTFYAPAVRAAKRKEKSKARRKDKRNVLKEENEQLKARLAQLEGKDEAQTA